MNIRQIAIVAIRVASIGWMFSIVPLVIYLPVDFARVHLWATVHVSSASIVSAKAAIVNLFVHVAFALGLYVYAEPLARLVTRDLVESVEESGQPAG